MNQREEIWQHLIVALSERLREPLRWYPFPFIISFGLALIVTGHVIFSSNPRLGHPAHLITFAAEPQIDDGIWLSLSPLDQDLVVTTADRQVFRWPLNSHGGDDLQRLEHYLHTQVVRELESVALLNMAYRDQASVVLAIDQTLTFAHVRPVIHAIGRAGISRYSFETRTLKTSSSAPVAAGDRSIY